jgi:hypothetical protein
LTEEGSIHEGDKSETAAKIEAVVSTVQAGAKEETSKKIEKVGKARLPCKHCCKKFKDVVAVYYKRRTKSVWRALAVCDGIPSQFRIPTFTV